MDPSERLSQSVPATGSYAMPAAMPAPATGAPVFCALLLAAESLWLGLTYALPLSVVPWFAGHIVLIGLALAWVIRDRSAGGGAVAAGSARPDLSGYVLALLGCLIAGPAGGLLAMIAVVWLSRHRTDGGLLAAWYDRIALAGDIDPVTRLCNTVAMGRAVQTTTDVPKVFSAVMASGSLEDRQTALGLIARRFSPAYAAALRAALVSSEPVIRVQAAAVAVKVRAELKHTLQATLSAAAQPMAPWQGIEVAGELQAIIGSGLIEDVDRPAAEASVARLVSAAVDAMADWPAGSGVPPELPHSSGVQALLETELLRRGRFEAFRAIRVQSLVPSAPAAANGLSGPEAPAQAGTPPGTPAGIGAHHG